MISLVLLHMLAKDDLNALQFYNALAGIGGLQQERSYYVIDVRIDRNTMHDGIRIR